MLSKSTLLKHYKRKDVQEALVANAADREIGVRYGEAFGKRPDVLRYPSEVLEAAMNGATSFHATEERWRDPLQLDAEMSKREQEALRIGWDLVLDVDCKDWELSKLIAHLMVKALQAHNVSAITCKFSGNKGFHIGVPFEAFPHTSVEKSVAERFPDDTRIITLYLVEYVKRQYGNEFRTRLLGMDKKELSAKLGIAVDELTKAVCVKCGKELKVERKQPQKGMLCMYCGQFNTPKPDAGFFQCARCKKLNKVESSERQKCQCGSGDFKDIFDISRIMDIDVGLISSRHMYRMPYSLHEKSGLCSVLVPLDTILGFERESADPDKVIVPAFHFMGRKSVSSADAKQLFDAAFSWHTVTVTQKEAIRGVYETRREQSKGYEVPAIGVAVEHFPPCIRIILAGIRDGKKRSLFILLNFLRSAGWGYDKIEELLLGWNAKNNEPLREVHIKGSIRYHKASKKLVMPPNCNNKAYYLDMGFCHPDGFCKRIRNPVSYALLKAKEAPKAKRKAGRKSVKKKAAGKGKEQKSEKQMPSHPLQAP
ncbi:TPA: hypothetical protein HA361_03320 [Candidatus Woesearchaeota archaeon]|nr:hypothetical protein [Candidatus Woesearchaeota archaeon]HII68649.1 hypothetical protein [Candidatus Woesearchaeota archaeon]